MKWFTSPKIEFITTLPVTKIVHPISPMRLYKPEWLTKEAKRFAETKNDKSISRCPGIRKLFSKGWVVFNWMDSYVKINEDLTFEWKTNINQKNICPIPADYLEGHKIQPISNGIPTFKLSTPWLAKTPDGYSLYMKGMPYQEHDMFTVGEGMMSNEFGLTGITFHLIFKKPGEYFLPAGMPLAHLMCVKDEDVKEVFRDATKEEIQQHLDESAIKYSRIVPSYKEMKAMIAAYGKQK